MKFAFIGVVAAIIARGILGLIDPSALNAPDRPKSVAPHAQVSVQGPPGTVSGHVRETETGEQLIGASVVVEGTELGAATDLRGEYIILKVPSGTRGLTASYVGFHVLTAITVLDSIHGARADFWLAPSPIHIGPVE